MPSFLRRFAARVVPVSAAVSSIACAGSAGSPAPAVAAPAPAPATAAALARVAGCYRIKLGEWSVTGAKRGLIPNLEFRLDTASVPSVHVDGARLLVTPRAHPGARFSYWRLDGDALEVVWSNGFSSARIKAAVQGNELLGTAWSTGEERTTSPDPSASVSGEKVGCR